MVVLQATALAVSVGLALYGSTAWSRAWLGSILEALRNAEVPSRRAPARGARLLARASIAEETGRVGK